MLKQLKEEHSKVENERNDQSEELIKVRDELIRRE
jgi:hypothetical protein